MNLLKGKNVIITGGSRGIGKGIAEKFAQNGANIAFTCIEMSDESIELSKNLEKLGVKAKAYVSDAADFEAAQKLHRPFITRSKLDSPISSMAASTPWVTIRPVVLFIPSIQDLTDCPLARERGESS